MDRRSFLVVPLALAGGPAHAGVAYAPVTGGRALAFPRDHGSHPDFRTEWWYVTGWLAGADGEAFGVQVTFFRSRPGVAEASPSAFAPRQLLFAHAALADARHGRLRHDQRAARAGFGLAEASEATTDVRIHDWSLVRADDVYRASIVGREFALRLDFRPTLPVLPQGDAGVSRKGPRPEQASHYYSLPQLAVTGTVERDGRTLGVTGQAWLDHEWSSEYLAGDAAGWDWIGINLDDGGAVMAFRIRDRSGAALWAGGTDLDGSGRTRALAPGDVRFVPTRRWRSPRTGIDYPVAFEVKAGKRTLALAPLMDDQELDARGSVGIVYWEGAVTATSAGRRVGRGYLELTGYGEPLRL